MKKIVVMSDSHGYHQMIDEVYTREQNADFYVHCGDSEAYKEMMQGWITVKGNNDWMGDFNEQIIFQAEDLTFLVCHGHRFGYFEREKHMIETLKKYKCQVLLSGHTHIPHFEQKEGFYLINPGSTTLPRGGSPKSYCVLTVDGQKLSAEFKTLK